MMSPVRKLLRWAIAALLVTIPATYLLWQWRFEEHKVLGRLSYEAFHERVASNSAESYWTYFLYALGVIGSVNALTALVAWGIGRVFPDRAVRVPKAK